MTGWVLLALAGVLTVLALGFFAHRTGTSAVRALIEANNETSAQMSRQLVEQQFADWVYTLEVFSRLPEVREAVAARDEAVVRGQLRALVEGRPHVVRAFVVSPSALLWSDFPRAPESLGRRFHERDWYRGVSRAWTPYVSEVYRRHADPQPLLVAIAAPVSGPGGEVAGAVVYQVVLEDLAGLLEQVEIGRQGYVYLLDHRGQVAAHPRLPGGRGEPVRVPQSQAGASMVRGPDPITGEAMLATSVGAQVGGNTWTVVTQQPAALALAPLRDLAWRIGLAGVIALLLIGGLTLRLFQLHLRARNWNERLEAEVAARTDELRDKEEQLRQSQKMQAIGQLAGGVAHDFNNLLSVIIGVTAMRLDDWRREGLPGGDEQLRDDLIEIRKAGERGALLTRSLLAISRKEVRQPRLLDLGEVVEESVGLLERLVGEHIEIDVQVADELDLVSFDPGQLEQILLNLVVNARDAMPRGGRLTIETRNVHLDESYVEQHAEAEVGPHVLLAVSDTGDGMDAATRERIFEPFFTTKGAGEGTGLGLATVYGIVKQSGGNIWVYSEPGRGTVFKVYLPRAEASPGAVREAEPPTGALQGTETLLIVEDDPAVQRLMAAALEADGYTVLAASDADDALALVEQHGDAIEMLITDVILPKVGGPDLAAVLVERIPGLRVLFVSGYTGGALAAYVDDAEQLVFLEKPIRPGRLRRKVRETLDSEAEQG